MPTIWSAGGIRVAFASNDCPEREHAHAIVGQGQAKFWIVPAVELDRNHRLTQTELRAARNLVEERRIECVDYWRRHCSELQG